MYSSPPANGARIAFKVLSNPQYRKRWEDELKGVSGRIIEMRKALYDELVRLQVPGSWDHIVKQIGMFSYTGLTGNKSIYLLIINVFLVKQCECLIEKHHIYLIKNGRISMVRIKLKYFVKIIRLVLPQRM